MQTDAIQNGIIIDFLYFPDVYYLNEEIKSYKAWQFFINVAKTEGIIINDPWEYFMENKDSDNMSWSFIDFHPNCKAHEIMANYIVKKITGKTITEHAIHSLNRDALQQTYFPRHTTSVVKDLPKPKPTN